MELVFILIKSEILELKLIRPAYLDIKKFWGYKTSGMATCLTYLGWMGYLDITHRLQSSLKGKLSESLSMKILFGEIKSSYTSWVVVRIK